MLGPRQLHGGFLLRRLVLFPFGLAALYAAHKIYGFVCYRVMTGSGSKRALEDDSGAKEPAAAASEAGDAGARQGKETLHKQGGSGRTGGDTRDAPVRITNVLESIGIEVYKYLHPKDLLSFSLTSHRVHEEVSSGLIQACMRQLPPNFGSRGENHVISFKDRHSFPKKEMLLDHLLEKVRAAELKLVIASDPVATRERPMEESLAKARELLKKKTGAKFVSYNLEELPHLQAEYTSAGYNYETDNKKLATSRTQYMLSRMAMEGEAMSRHIPIVKTWMEYILSQKRIVAGTWFWSCRHRSLDFQGVEGKGVMISSDRDPGEEMEICWTRLTASRV